METITYGANKADNTHEIMPSSSPLSGKNFIITAISVIFFITY